MQATQTPAAIENPGELVVEGVDRFMQLAATWLAWDGRPRIDESGERVYTPHKAVRRHTDHLIDHLAEIEALLAGEQTEPDRWYGSIITLGCDWAPFTEPDLAEAGQRLRRLANTYAIRLAAVGVDEWDKPRNPNWTLRQIVEHVAPPWYAEQVGDLRPT